MIPEVNGGLTAHSTSPSFYQGTSLWFFVLSLVFIVSSPVESFTFTRTKSQRIDMVQQKLQHSASIQVNTPSTPTTSLSAELSANSVHHNLICDLPGDPSLILTTNVDLGSTKIDVMKGTKHL